MTLERHHLEQLAKSAIAHEVIIERGYCSVTNKAELASLGFNSNQQRVPGLLIPLWGVDGKPVGYQLRPDNPRQNKEGKSVKYENPKGSSIRLDCPPRCQGALGNPNVPLWVTEGIKKDDAIASLGQCAIALTGVWGFKGKNRFGSSTILADWDYIALKGRTVYLAFDSDILVKREVQQALDRLGSFLRNKGANTLIVNLPHDNGKVGIDDYLAKGHTISDVLTLAEPYLGEPEPTSLRRNYFSWRDSLHLEVRMLDGTVAFAYLDNGKVKFATEVALGNGKVIIPQPLPKGQGGTEIPIVGLPDETIAETPLFQPKQLVDKFLSHITRYVDLLSLDTQLSYYYALFTWFYPKTNTVPYLRYRADTGTGKSRAEKATGDLCFYPFITSGASSFSGIARTAEKWRGTLVMDEADLSGDMSHHIVKYLNLGFERGKYYVLSDKQNPKFQDYFDPFMPKILAMRQRFEDNATEGRLLSITMHETSNPDIPIILPKEYEVEMQRLRNEIALFVMHHWNEVDGNKMADFKHLDIEPRLKQLAMPLSIIFQVWPDGAKQFEGYLKARQKELKRDRGMSWEGSLFNLVYAIAKGDIDLSGKYAEYYANDEVLGVSPSMVADQVKSSARAVSQALQSIGFIVEPRYVKSQGKKKSRLYVVPNEKTWNEMVSRYYYDEESDQKPSLPDVLRSNKFSVC